jgi:dihydrofolate synthase/folylpolyglutamate synthase
MQDKDIAGMFESLLPDAQAVVLTHATNPRSLQLEALGALAAPYARPVSTAATVPEALRRAAALAGPQALVLVTGSVALVGEARTALGFTDKE